MKSINLLTGCYSTAKVAILSDTHNAHCKKWKISATLHCKKWKVFIPIYCKKWKNPI